MKQSKNYKIVVGLIVGMVLSSTYTYAATSYAIESKNISYEDNSSLGVDNVQAAIDGTCTKFSTQLTNLKQEVINEMYPKGSIYITTELSTPAAVAEKLGGTWVAYGQGRTLVGVGSNGTTTYAANSSGGKSTATLSTTNLPSHAHTIPSLSGTTVATNHTFPLAGSGAYSITPGGITDSVVLGTKYSTDIKGSDYVEIPSLSLSTVASTTTTCNNCNGTSFSVQDPYVTVYMYKRVA